MLRYIYHHDLHAFPALAKGMFRDRADQFGRRLRWDVTIDEKGFERDEYDALNPLYVIWEPRPGVHGGSMRFLPTTGRTMIAEHFGGIADCSFSSPNIWECTRFCLGQGADGRVAAALMLGGGELMRAFHVDHFVGVFDRRMERIYRLIGSAPQVLGSAGEGKDKISVGLWSFHAEDRARVLRRAGLSPSLSEAWFARSFGFAPGQSAPTIAA